MKEEESMIKTTLKINGMACSMCEAHVNDVIRRIVPGAKSVKSSHAKGESSFLSESEPNADALKDEIAKTGYEVVLVKMEPAQKKRFGLF